MIRTFSIFVSSVQKELAAERRAVRDFITQDIFLRRFFPDVLLFEDTPAKDRRPDGVYLSEIGRRDIYLGLFAHEYGGKDAQGISATEREFDHATAKRRERLIFVKGADDSGRDPNMVRLIRKAGDQLTRRRFSDLASLLREVYASLVDFLEDKRALRTVPFDAAPCDGATLRDIDPAKVRAFIEAADAKGRLNLRGARNPSAVLRHLDLFTDDVLTHAALFLFGRNPRRLLQKTQMHCAHFHGTQKRKPIASHQVFEGTAFEIIDLALEFVLGKLVRRVGVVTKKASAPIDYEIPIEVIRESLVNGVAHKDYLSSGFVQALVFPDRVEIWNPGELPPGLSMEDLRKPHGPVPRNPLIAEPLFRAGYAEKLGTGTTDMIDACRAAGLPEPDFEQRDSYFVTTLWRDWITTESLARLNLNERQLQAVAFMKSHGQVSNSDYQRLTGATSQTALRDLRAMLARGLIEKIGNTGRSTRYRLLRKLKK